MCEYRYIERGPDSLKRLVTHKLQTRLTFRLLDWPGNFVCMSVLLDCFETTA